MVRAFRDVCLHCNLREAKRSSHVCVASHFGLFSALYWPDFPPAKAKTRPQQLHCALFCSRTSDRHRESAASVIRHQTFWLFSYRMRLMGFFGGALAFESKFSGNTQISLAVLFTETHHL